MHPKTKGGHTQEYITFYTNITTLVALYDRFIGIYLKNI